MFHGTLSSIVKMYEKVSIQSCSCITKDSGEEFDRLGSKAFYAFVYPNFMINRLAISFPLFFVIAIDLLCVLVSLADH